MNTDQLRNEFEAWFCDRPLPVTSHSPDGGYTKESLEWAFQSAAQSRDELIRKLVEACRQSLGYFALFNDEGDRTKWPRFVITSEQALAEAKAMNYGIDK